MGQDLGRVSGPLLSENLLRHGTDLAFETNLLYLDVNNGKIGVTTDAPIRTLYVPEIINTTNLIVDTEFDIANFTFIDNKIQNPTGSITIRPNQLSNPTVTVPGIVTQNLDFEYNSITNFVNANDIEVTANGIGTVIFTTERVNVSGNLHATGDITWDGTITFGNDNSDSVLFNTDVTSSIIPDVSNAFDIGNLNSYWKKLYTVNIDATSITSPTFTTNNIDLLLTQGKTIYVSKNGNDVYSSASTKYTGPYNNATEYLIGDLVEYNGLYYKRVADPLNQGYAPSDTIRWVVSEVTLNAGTHVNSPFKTIKKALSVAQPGDEILIFPGSYEEIFPLTVPQGVSVRGTGVRSVTITPTSGTNTNDAFLLNGETTVCNLTVQSYYYNEVADTGYGFRFADNILISIKSPYMQNCTLITSSATAGRGAMIDGSVANVNSIHPSMLFYAVTMIIPNADGITATNDVRVEWLNCFTYYAYRGIYLKTGTNGGAEFRSINSANIYGTYGAVADGIGTKGYLTSHNFSYVGSVLESNNDPTTSIQDNEVVTINGGIIIYESTNHKGDFRIGDVFYVEQETGNVYFNAQTINFTSSGSIVFESEYGITRIDPTAIQTGNIIIHDNDIHSITGPVNFLAASTTTTLNTDVYVTGLLSITNDAIVKGNIFLGNDTFDTVAVAPDLTQTIKPNQHDIFTLGKKGIDPKVWDTLYLTSLDVDAITQITNNTISTLSSDYDIILQASTTGQIHVSSTNVQINNNLTVDNTTAVNGSTTIQDLMSNGIITLVGDINQTGDYDIIGTFANNNIIIDNLLSHFSVPNITIEGNDISATFLNNDLQFFANGTGGVKLDDKIKITDTTISNDWVGASTTLEKSIVLTPNGTGFTNINSNTYLTLPIGNQTDRFLSTPGEIRQNSTTLLYEGNSGTGNVSFYGVYDSDRNTYITPELSIGANDNTLRFFIDGTLKATIDPTKLYHNVVDVDNIRLTDNTISNTHSINDLWILPAGNGDTNLNGIKIQDSLIKNELNTPIILESTSAGYFKFTGGALVIPFGTTAERRLTPELGELRQNTEIQQLEVFNGEVWIPAVGGTSATINEVTEILDFWSLILG